VVYAADGHMVAVAGMKGVVVVHTPDATLVLPAERAQEVKDLLETVRTRNWHKFL
jgi:mannose-1-phosphate guanylyltransferase